MQSIFRLGVSFFFELIILVIQLYKCITWTIFYFIFPPTEKYVRNEIVLITGSAKGLGRQIALDFAKRGSVLILLDNDDVENNKTVDLVKSSGLSSKRVYAYHCDLSSREEVKTICDRIKKDIGDVTIIVNNAGIQSLKSFIECREDEFLQTMRVNLYASYWFIKEFLPAMLSRNHGHIVSIVGSAGLFGFCHTSDYCSSKFALIGMLESLDHELHQAGYDGVITTLVYPTPINTQLHAKSRQMFNYFIKPLTTQYAAKKIMRAILINQKAVCIPRILYILPILKSFLPTKAFMLCINFVLHPSRPDLESASILEASNKPVNSKNVFVK